MSTAGDILARIPRDLGMTITSYMHHSILQRFPLPTVRDVQPIGSGLINTTYKVTTDGGVFVLQKLHDVIPDAAAQDMRVVTAHLAAHGLRVPALQPTTDGAAFARAADGSRWRVYPWIAGRVVDAVTDAHMAREAGRIVGDMHRVLQTLSYTPQGSIPHFHDTPFIVEALLGVRAQMPDEVAGIADDVLATLPAVIITDQPRQLIHGDLKISNLLFDDAGKAVGVIDFDTILFHQRTVDLGDALRSWCNRTAEDDPHATFDHAFFAAAAEGYTEGFGSVDDRALLLRGARQITMELAARFLIDVVRDTYFGFDTARYPTRRAANIARAIGQHHLATTIPVA